MLPFYSPKWLFFSAILFLAHLSAQAQSRLKLSDIPESANSQVRVWPNRQGGGSPSGVTAIRPLGYLPTNVVNTITTYTDLGTRGTRIRTPNNTDDDYSGAQNIGFNFRYRGKVYTNFVLNTNGFIKLGTEPGSVPDLFLDGPQVYTGGALYSSDAVDSNIIAPFNVDLAASDSGPAEFRVLTTGVAGQRVCTIQWKSMKDKVALQLLQIDFQLKLYETTNFIEFVYGDFVGTEETPVFRSAAVGLRGRDDQVLFGSKFSGGPWTSTVFLTDPTGVNQHNYRNSFLPSRGRTYRFTTTLQNNIGLGGILGLPGPACNQGIVDSIGIIVVNSGSARQTQIPIRVKVDRNAIRTALIPALDSGKSDTVFVGPFDFTVPGNYGVEAAASLVGDQLPGNDTLRPDSVENIIPRPADGRINGFEDERALQGWVQLNLNRDGFNWQLAEDSSRAHSGSRFLFLSNNSNTNGGSNDMLISGCYGLQGRRRYKLRFHLTNLNPVGPAKIEILALRSQTSDTTGAIRIWRNDNFRQYRLANGYIDTTVRFFVRDTGAHYIAFYVFSAPHTNILALDDVSLDTATGLAPAVAIKDPIKTRYQVVPNPAGPAGFAVVGLAKTSYGILIDAIGRRRTLLLRKEDGYKVNEQLPPGLYTLQIDNSTLRLVVE